MGCMRTHWLLLYYFCCCTNQHMYVFNTVAGATLYVHVNLPVASFSLIMQHPFCTFPHLIFTILLTSGVHAQPLCCCCTVALNHHQHIYVFNTVAAASLDVYVNLPTASFNVLTSKKVPLPHLSPSHFPPSEEWGACAPIGCCCTIFAAVLINTCMSSIQ